MRNSLTSEGRSDPERVADGIRTRDIQIHNLDADSSKANSSKDLRISPPSVGHHLATDACQTDSDLASVIDAWDRLPEAVRAGIVAMVRAAGGGR